MLDPASFQVPTGKGEYVLEDLVTGEKHTFETFQELQEFQSTRPPAPRLANSEETAERISGPGIPPPGSFADPPPPVAFSEDSIAEDYAESAE